MIHGAAWGTQQDVVILCEGPELIMTTAEPGIVLLTVIAGVAGAIGGLATSLRSREPLSVRATISEILNSLLAAIIVILLGYENFKSYPGFLLGLAAAIGCSSPSIILTFSRLLQWPYISVIIVGSDKKRNNSADRQRELSDKLYETTQKNGSAVMPLQGTEDDATNHS